jgi:beta-N-acetylhexosaminidase
VSGSSLARPAPVDAELRRSIAATLLPGFVGTTLPAWLEARLRAGLGGVCLFGQNISSPEQLRALTDAIRAANPDAVIAIDEEGGDVTRLHYATGSPFPGNAVLGRLDDTALTERVGREVGEELRRAGVTLDFAPDVDINSDPDNPVIGVRSFGTSPELVARHAAAWTRGLQSAGVAAAAKHFPGHGDTAADSHLELPVVDVPAALLRERELVPFRAAVAAGVRTVMTSHLLLPQLDPDLPATMSPTILAMLRDELGFDGVIVTDALDMHGASGDRGIPEAAVLALAAGCDLLCLGTENTDAQLQSIEDAIATAVATARLTPARLTEAAHRVHTLSATVASSKSPADTPSTDGGIEDAMGVAEVVKAFEVGERGRAWLGAHAGQVCSVVRVETVANIAVGVAPWGPFAAATADPADPAAAAFAANPCVVLDAGTGRDLALDAAAPVVVVGKDLHRHAFARAAIDRLRAERADVLVVDMGWPAPDRAYADIATFGASRLVGQALLELLGRGS